MSLNSLLKAGKLKRHKTSDREISDLFEVVQRDLKDASLKELSPDRRFATAYNAALQLTKIMMSVQGYRAASQGHHKTSFEFLASIEKNKFKKLASYFDLCRKKRNVTDYDRTEVVSPKETVELIEEVEGFYVEVEKMVKR